MSLIDLLKAKTSDIFAQREGERQFAKIGDKIAEDLLPLFETEGASLDEGDQIAVARAIAEAFDRSKLSSELLTKLNLEPTKLAQHIQTSHLNTTNLFSEAATSLYLHIIKEACTYVVNIASQLPSFTEHSFAEVLKREDQIIAIAKEALEELRKIRKQLDPKVETERFEIDYREAVARNLDFLHLIGAEVSLINRRHRLSVAYITLSVEQMTLIPSFPIPQSDQSSENTQDDNIQRIIAVDTALASSRSLLIRGLPGSGKTTLLQWVAVKAAARSFQGQLANWNNSVPFYIQLRRCVKSGLPKPQDFPGLISPAIAGTMPEGWVHSILKSGRAIVLVDGVDEVPESQREEVYHWLQDLKENFTKARFIITSRPHAVKEEEWSTQEGLGIADLQPMDLENIYEFIEHWHEAVRQELRIEDEKNELGPLAEHLKERIRQVHALYILATNPLLCAMLCALNRERRRKLPVNRIELYEACCSLLLYRREQESHINLPEYPDLDYGQKRRLLEDLAYWMLKAKLTEAEITVVDKRFEQQLAHMPNITRNASGLKMRKFFVERSGIVREPVEDHVDFVHRTFQEFLAAKAALDAMEVEVLIANAHNDQWREVVILAAGLASKTICEQLVGGLILRGDNDKKNSSQLYLLAVSCLESAIQLGPDVTSEVEKRLKQVIPPKNLTEAKVLAAAGDLAVPYLTDNSYYPTSVMVACIRTLTLIGSDAALIAIESYTKDSYLPRKVIEELCKGWERFDKTTYAERVILPLVKRGVTLRLAQLPSSDQHKYLRNLTSLAVINCKPLSNLSHLANLTQCLI